MHYLCSGILYTFENLNITYMRRKYKFVFTVVLGIAMLLNALVLKAQAGIELENTFNDHVYYYSSIQKYVNVVYSSKNAITVNLYNEDHSVYKSINIMPPYGYDYSDINFYSQKLFNDDDEIEFLVTYYNNNVDKNKISMCKLYNENGSILEDFGYAYYILPSLYTIDNLYKMRLEKRFYNAEGNRYYYSTEVYSLPGSGYSLSSNGVQVQNVNTNNNNIVALPYYLESGDKTEMMIYDANNKLVEKKEIDSTFDRVLLNVADYQAGTYYYSVDDSNHKFIVK